MCYYTQQYQYQYHVWGTSSDQNKKCESYLFIIFNMCTGRNSIDTLTSGLSFFMQFTHILLNWKAYNTYIQSEYWVVRTRGIRHEQQSLDLL